MNNRVSELLNFIKEDLTIPLTPIITETDDEITATIEIMDSDYFGVVLSKLDKCEKIKELMENDDFTQLKANKMYKTIKKPLYIINLLGDLTADEYVLLITSIEED